MYSRLNIAHTIVLFTNLNYNNLNWKLELLIPGPLLSLIILSTVLLQIVQVCIKWILSTTIVINIDYQYFRKTSIVTY